MGNFEWETGIMEIDMIYTKWGNGKPKVCVDLENMLIKLIRLYQEGDINKAAIVKVSYL